MTRPQVDATAPLLAVENLCVSYGKVEALHEARLRVETGTIVTVIGPNGAGKTTMLSAIMGLLARSRGEVRFRRSGARARRRVHGCTRHGARARIARPVRGS